MRHPSWSVVRFTCSSRSACPILLILLRCLVVRRCLVLIIQLETIGVRRVPDPRNFVVIVDPHH